MERGSITVILTALLGRFSVDVSSVLLFPSSNFSLLVAANLSGYAGRLLGDRRRKRQGRNGNESGLGCAKLNTAICR